MQMHQLPFLESKCAKFVKSPLGTGLKTGLCRLCFCTV